MKLVILPNFHSQFCETIRSQTFHHRSRLHRLCRGIDNVLRSICLAHFRLKGVERQIINRMYSNEVNLSLKWCRNVLTQFAKLRKSILCADHTTSLRKNFEQAGWQAITNTEALCYVSYAIHPSLLFDIFTIIWRGGGVGWMNIEISRKNIISSARSVALPTNSPFTEKRKREPELVKDHFECNKLMDEVEEDGVGVQDCCVLYCTFISSIASTLWVKTDRRSQLPGQMFIWSPQPTYSHNAPDQIVQLGNCSVCMRYIWTKVPNHFTSDVYWIPGPITLH